MRSGEERPELAALGRKLLALRLEVRETPHRVARLGFGVDHEMPPTELLERCLGLVQFGAARQHLALEELHRRMCLLLLKRVAMGDVGACDGIRHVAGQHRIGALVADRDDCAVRLQSGHAQRVAQPGCRGLRGPDLKLDARRTEGRRDWVQRKARDRHRRPVRASRLTAIGRRDAEPSRVAPNQVGARHGVAAGPEHAEQATSPGAPGFDYLHVQGERIHHVLRHRAAAEHLGFCFNGGRCTEGREQVARIVGGALILDPQRGPRLVDGALPHGEHHGEGQHERCRPREPSCLAPGGGGEPLQRQRRLAVQLVGRADL